MDANGSYYAHGRYVFRSPKRNPETGGTSMGFCVCKIAEDVSDDASQEIADALNAVESKRQWDEAIAANREEQEA